MNKKMRLSVGRIAAGPNYWLRPSVIDTLLRKLRRSDVSFLGPRRTGKTSSLWHLRDAHSNDERTFIYLNVEKYRTEEQWLLGMIEELRKLKEESVWGAKWSAFSSGAVKSLQRLREIKIAGTSFAIGSGHEKTWQEIGDEFFAALRSIDQEIVFLVDEFPVLVKRIAERSPIEATDLLHWFRANRQLQGNITFLVTGSIGLTTVARRYSLGKQINDFEPYRIPPMSVEDARELARKLAEDNELPVDDETIDWMLERIGATWPYFIQLFLAAIEDLGLPVETKLTKAQLEDLYETRLIDQTYNQYLENMWERLGDYFDTKELKIASALLSFAAQRPGQITTNALRDVYLTELSVNELLEEAAFTYLLDVLHHDGYLIPSESEENWRFSSDLLRDFWNRKTRS